MEEDMELEQSKADVYETWAVINRAFEQIITALDKLEKRVYWMAITCKTTALLQTTCGPRSIVKFLPR